MVLDQSDTLLILKITIISAITSLHGLVEVACGNSPLENAAASATEGQEVAVVTSEANFRYVR